MKIKDNLPEITLLTAITILIGMMLYSLNQDKVKCIEGVKYYVSYGATALVDKEGKPLTCDGK